MKNLYIRTVSNKKQPIPSAKATKRKANLDRIRLSIKDTPVFKSYSLLNLKRLEQQQLLSPIGKDSDHDSTSTIDDNKDKEGFPNYVVFEEKYELLEKIGEGTHGVVRKCRKRRNGDIFAVKSFSFEDEHFSSLKSNFIFMKRLKHSSIIRYESLYLDIKKRTGWLVM
jgi:hypothetical protein